MISLTARFRMAYQLLIIVGLVFYSNAMANSQDVPAAGQNVGHNVLLICVDDLRPELACFGKPYIQSPNIDALAGRGVRFPKHYVQAPTCGASRYTLLTGTYGPRDNGALFARAKKWRQSPESVPVTMPGWFRSHGYTTVSVGKVSHHPGGRGGKDWDDEKQPELPDAWDRHLLPAGPWQHPRGAMHGLAHGEIRQNASKMAVYQSEDGPDSIYPDGLIVDKALSQMEQLAKAQSSDSQPTGSSANPFFLAVGIIRPHLPFGAPAKYLRPYSDISLPPIPHPGKPNQPTTWHGSGEFMKYNRWGRNPNTDSEFATLVRKHYAACVSYADASVGRLLDRLESLGLNDNTTVILWGDHGWHLGEHAVWGKHTLFEESLRSPLVIATPDMKRAGGQSNAMVETLDLFPTLCELTGIPAPSGLDGQSLTPFLDDLDHEGHHAVSYNAHQTVRTQTHRLIRHRNGFVELYDHTDDPGETKNIATEHPKLAEELSEYLTSRLNP